MVNTSHEILVPIRWRKRSHKIQVDVVETVVWRTEWAERCTSVLADLCLLADKTVSCPGTDISIDVVPHVTLSYDMLHSPNSGIADIKGGKNGTTEASRNRRTRRLSCRIADKGP